MGEFSIIIVAIISLGGPLFLYLQNRSNNKRLEQQASATLNVESQKLDGAVMDRSKVMYDGMIFQLEAQVSKLRSTIDVLEKDLDEERDENDKLRAKIRELENQADDLDNQIYHLKIQLDRITKA